MRHAVFIETDTNGETTMNEAFRHSIADRNEAIYQLSDEGKSHEEIAAALEIDISIVRNFLVPDDMGG
jgi:DNA-binding NarL/FixJ family response regulator